jgi:hypothetical protein
MAWLWRDGVARPKLVRYRPRARWSRIAQLVEQATVNRSVVGSSPTPGANHYNGLREIIPTPMATA